MPAPTRPDPAPRTLGASQAGTAPGPTPGAPEKDAVRSMFDRIAPRYDLLNRLLSAGTDVRWRRAAVDFLDLRPPLRVLDLCTGTADLLVEALERHPDNRGTGVDLSAAMLSRGRAKLTRRGFEGRAAVAGGDAERLPFAAGTFHAALVAFGIRNVGDTGAALREVHRVLAPEGRFVVLEFSMPSGPLGSVYGLYFRSVLPRIGALVSGDPGAYAYLPASVGRFPEPGRFLAAMEEAGFRRLSRRPLTLGIAQLYRGEKAA